MTVIVRGGPKTASSKDMVALLKRVWPNLISDVLQCDL